MIKDWIEDYKPKTAEDYKQALREIMQQLIFFELAQKTKKDRIGSLIYRANTQVVI